MARASEFNGKDDGKKTIPILPRPLRDPSLRLRMGYISGDESGNTKRDGGRAWRGEAPEETT